MRRSSGELSERDLAVLSFVAQVRVASARQIERLAFPPGDGSAQSTARRARRRLQQLTEAGLLQRLQRRIGGVRAGSAGYLYAVGTRGRSALGLTGRGARRQPSARFVDHCLAVAQVHVDLVVAERCGEIRELAVVHEPDCWRRYLGPHAVAASLKPDLTVDLTAHDWNLNWFVEVDRGSEHLPTVLTKCRAYVAYWQSGREVERREVFPRVLWSAVDQARAEQIERAIAGDQRLPEGLFVVATAADTKAALSAPPTNTKNERREI